MRCGRLHSTKASQRDSNIPEKPLLWRTPVDKEKACPKIGLIATPIAFVVLCQPKISSISIAEFARVAERILHARAGRFERVLLKLPDTSLSGRLERRHTGWSGCSRCRRWSVGVLLPSA